eukprot:1281219-Rhodomonas_salina.1
MLAASTELLAHVFVGFHGLGNSVYVDFALGVRCSHSCRGNPLRKLTAHHHSQSKIKPNRTAKYPIFSRIIVRCHGGCWWGT